MCTRSVTTSDRVTNEVTNHVRQSPPLQGFCAIVPSLRQRPLSRESDGLSACPAPMWVVWLPQDQPCLGRPSAGNDAGCPAQWPWEQNEIQAGRKHPPWVRTIPFLSVPTVLHL